MKGGAKEWELQADEEGGGAWWERAAEKRVRAEENLSVLENEASVGAKAAAAAARAEAEEQEAVEVELVQQTSSASVAAAEEAELRCDLELQRAAVIARCVEWQLRWWLAMLLDAALKVSTPSMAARSGRWPLQRMAVLERRVKA